MDAASPAEPFLVVLGSARLPKSLGGEHCSALMIELALAQYDRRVVDVATTVPLPSYAGLLRSLLVGRHLDEISGVLEQLPARLRGPLLRPTIAALANAVSNAETVAVTAGGLSGNS